MKKVNLDELLCCPECGGLLLESKERLKCEACDKAYAVVNGIPRFVETELYVENFGFQWNKHKRTQFDNEKKTPSESFLRTIGLSPEVVKDKLVLDAGCGSGRYSDVINRWGGKVIAMDLSSAVEACYENLGNRGVMVVQGDILKPPLKKESFDVVFSIGVLHHTPNTKQAFKSILTLLKPGGHIVIWLYHSYNDDCLRMKLSKFYRKVTWRLPKRFLYAVSHLAIPYYYLNKIPFLRSITGRIWHIAEHEDWRWRVLDTFDWYSPRYQWHHTYTEVWKWFEEEGLVNIRISEPPVSISAVKPSNKI
ncbi:MAG: class I SAM-dependent methyltransferase [Deltaproteobacteria bacterium]|nr:class I SAM-dependent methyltransferase [Deltaproteobacteria bacterium]